MDLAAIASALQSADSLRLEGILRSTVRAARADGRLVTVRRGWFVDATTWAGWHTESRVVARAIATKWSGFDGEVASSHTDALAMHGLPLYRCAPRHSHVTGPRANGGVGREGVARHRASVAGDVVELDGLVVTSLPRTIADVIGRLAPVSAVAATDAALRHVAWRGGRDPYDEVAADDFRDAVRRCAALQPGARGRVQAEWVLAFADGRAQLPGESATRFQLHRLGFARPRLQVRVDLPGGRWYDIDFGLDDVAVWLEFDGTGKYTDAALRRGRDPLEIVLAEKEREDVIRGMTHRPLLRVGSSHVASVEALRARLKRFAVTAPSLVCPRFTPAVRSSSL